MKKLPLTVSLVIHNEADCLRRCLDSCADLADEIIVLHDGECTDDSLKIAREYTDKVFTRPRLNASEPHRPEVYKMAKNKWILQLDGDEYLTPELQNVLPQLISDTSVGLYEIKWFDEYDGKRTFTIYKQILFQKSKCYFIGAVSEYTKPLPGVKIKYVEQGLINAPEKNVYQSFGYFWKKYTKIARVQARQYVKPFSSVICWNYEGRDWEPKTKIKIDHPIILGIFGMTAKYSLGFFGLAFATLMRKPYYGTFRSILYLIIFNIVLFFKVWQLQQQKI